MTLVQLHKKGEPIERHVEKDAEHEGLSPMAPPDAYSPPGAGQSIPYEEMHAFLKGFRDDHTAVRVKVEAFEEALTKLKETGITREVSAAFQTFFRALDEDVFPHNRREEKELFPLLGKRLIENGECSKGSTTTTACDVLTDDHIRLVQLAAISLNFFALASRLPDERSKLLVFDVAIEQAKALVELLQLHMFREDNVVFSLAHKYIKSEELDALGS